MVQHKQKNVVVDSRNSSKDPSNARSNRISRRKKEINCQKIDKQIQSPKRKKTYDMSDDSGRESVSSNMHSVSNKNRDLKCQKQHNTRDDICSNTSLSGDN